MLTNLYFSHHRLLIHIVNLTDRLKRYDVMASQTSENLYTLLHVNNQLTVHYLKDKTFIKKENQKYHTF